MCLQKALFPCFTNNYATFTETGLHGMKTTLSLVQVFHRIWLKLLQRRYSYRRFAFLQAPQTLLTNLSCGLF
jgi:hypothetical protein